MTKLHIIVNKNRYCQIKQSFKKTHLQIKFGILIATFWGDMAIFVTINA